MWIANLSQDKKYGKKASHTSHINHSPQFKHKDAFSSLSKAKNCKLVRIIEVTKFTI